MKVVAADNKQYSFFSFCTLDQRERGNRGLPSEDADQMLGD